MKTTLIITTLVVALAAGLAQAQEIVPLPEATKRQMQRQVASASKKHAEVEVPIARAIDWAIYAPRPQYPYEARARQITGRGAVVVNIERNTGLVESAKIVRSSGSPILDNAALSAFRQWQFRAPTPVSKVLIPFAYVIGKPAQVPYS
jgi:protein TonB